MAIATFTPSAPSAELHTLDNAAATGSARSRFSVIRAVVLALLFGLVATVLSLPQSASAATATHSRTSYETSIGNSVLRTLNAERRAHHLAPLSMNRNLQLSARRHDITMARFNAMSHQLRGEASFSRRITTAGYTWRAAGENIAWNSQMNTHGVLQLEVWMYNEKAPANGHRLNILSRNFANVGVDVYLDQAHHKVWLTTDFGHRR